MSINLTPNSENMWLQVGNYLVENNRWGAGNITEGPAPDQFEQEVGVSRVLTPAGGASLRIKWRWPNPADSSEVKGYPAILAGRKPGYYSYSNLMNGLPIYKLDGTVDTTAPSGHTPDSILPKHLPISTLNIHSSATHLTTPTGQGQLTLDIWLQEKPEQDIGFSNASITHEIMVPLANWGNYGAHKTPGGRNPNWYDHSVMLGGKLYHVYVTKKTDGHFDYNFGSLNNIHGRTGWKMIAFVPDVLPVPSGTLDVAPLINYISTRKDIYGVPWGTGKEYLSSIELGIEPVHGAGDMEIIDFRIDDLAEPVVLPVPVAPTAPAWVRGKQYIKGSVVTYNGALYTAKYDNPGYIPTVSTYYWRPNTRIAPYDPARMYTVGDQVSFIGNTYTARGVNFTNIKPNDARYWRV